MYKLILVLLIAVFSSPTFASSYFDSMSSYADAIYSFFTVDAPSTIERFWAWCLEWYLKAEIYIKLETVKIFWGIAKAYLDNLGTTALLQNYMGQLPNDLQYVLTVSRIPEAMMLILNAFVTKLAMRAI